MSIKAFWEKIWNKFATKKRAVIGVIAVLVLIITFLQGIDWVRERFIEGEVVFKTTDVFPDVNDRTYNLIVLSNREIVPIVNPMPEGEIPKEAAGPRNNITFTVRR